MNPLLIRRRGMMQAPASSPYQRIEYLQSTGVEFIDTNIVFKYDKSFETEFEFEAAAALRIVIFGSYDSTYKISFNIETTTDRKMRIYCARSSSVSQKTSLYYTLNSWNTFKLQYDGNRGITYNLNGYADSFAVSNTVYGVCSHPQRVYLDYMENTTQIEHGIKLKSLKCKQEGVEVIDFIPVRVGTVGYMYDRVSGQLFGNAGTGAFILGPDIQ